MTKLNIIIATPALSGGHGSGGGVAMLAQNDLKKFKNDAKYSLNYTETRGGYLVLFSPFFLAKSFLKIITLKLKNKVDLVHIHMSNKGSVYRKILLSELLNLLHIPYTFHLHSRQELLKLHPWLKSLVRKNLIKASKIIVLGKIWKKMLISKMLIPKKKISVLKNATTPLVLKTKQKKKNTFIKILFLGKLCSEKGTYDLINALNNLKKLKNWRATFAGDGDIIKIRNLVEKLNINHRVKVLGWLSHIESHKLLAKSDILVLPSYRENMPVSIIEAMSYGLPVIATPVGAVAEIIKNNKSGILIKPGDIGALTNNLKKLINLKKLRLNLGKTAKKYYIQNLNYDSYKKKLKIIWQDSVR